MSDHFSRRDLLKASLATGAGLLSAAALDPMPAIAETITAADAPPPRSR